MKILFALPGFHRFDRGAEVALLSVAEAMAEAGDRVTVIGSGEHRPGKAYEYKKLPAVSRERFEKFPFFPPLRSETAWEDATFALGLLRESGLANYDAVVTCSFPFTHWALEQRCRGRATRVFVTQNGDWPARSRASEYRTFSTDLLVCTNPDYLKNNRERWHCAMIPNGVDLRRFSPGPAERAKLGLPKDGSIVLMVSAFIETKRVADGIRAVARLPECHLVVAGDGPLRNEAEKLAQTLMPGRFHRLTLPPEKMPVLYRCANAFLHMSLLESFGNVFLEAWASGLPVVAHDSERLRWIMGTAGDHLCDTQDEEAVVQALRDAIRQPPIDPGADLNRFAWSNIAEQYHDAIRAVQDRAEHPATARLAT